MIMVFGILMVLFKYKCIYYFNLLVKNDHGIWYCNGPFKYKWNKLCAFLIGERQKKPQQNYKIE